MNKAERAKSRAYFNYNGHIIILDQRAIELIDEADRLEAERDEIKADRERVGAQLLEILQTDPETRILLLEADVAEMREALVMVYRDVHSPGTLYYNGDTVSMYTADCVRKAVDIDEEWVEADLCEQAKKKRGGE